MKHLVVKELIQFVNWLKGLLLWEQTGEFSSELVKNR